MADDNTPAPASAANIALLAAAAIMAGAKDEAWETRLIASARELKQLADPGSRVMRAISEFDGISSKGEEMELKHFTGVVLGIMREDKTSRGVVSLYTATPNPEYGSLASPRPHPLTNITTRGVEHVRTDRTDNAVDLSAKNMANRIGRSLIGHKVKCTVKMEKSNKGRKVRTLIAVEDLGVTTDADALALMQASGIQVSPEASAAPAQ